MQVSASAAVRANFHHLVFDVVWFGLAFAATSRFLSVFAIRFGANADVLSWMTSLPAIMVMISATFAAVWRQRFSHLASMNAMYWPDLLFRLVFILPALTPFLPAEWQTGWLIFSAAFPALGQGLGGVIFIVALNESIPKDQMVALIGRRSLAFNISLGICVLAYGAWLRMVSFPLNFQLMFVLAFVASLISKWHVHQVVPVVPATTSDAPARRNAPPPTHGPWRSPQFRTMLLAIALYHIAFFAAYAVIPLHLVRELGADEGFIAIFGLLELIGGALISTRGPQLLDRFGHRRMIAVAMAVTALSIALIAGAPSLPLTLVGALLSGAAWTMVGGLCTYGMYSEIVPQEFATRYSTAFHQVIGLAVFVGPFIGSYLAGVTTLSTVLWAGAALRLVASLTGQLVWGKPPASATGKVTPSAPTK